MSSINDYLQRLQPPQFDQIPDRLRAGRYHVLWNAEQRGEKIGKTPYNARAYLDNGKLYRASSTNERSWSTFPQAHKAYEHGQFSGIGTILLPARRIILIDIDHCIRTVVTKDSVIDEIKPAAQEIIDLLNSYTERSPGQDGLHIFPLAELPPDTRNRYRYKDIEIEIYASERYTTLTGQQLPGTPADLQERQAAVNALVERLECWERENTSGVCVCVCGDSQAQPAAASSDETKLSPPGVTKIRETPVSANQAQRSAPPIRESDLPPADLDVLAKARAARNAAVFTELWEGGDPKNRKKPSGQPNESAADFDLALMLLYWTNDSAEQTERLFRASKRYRDDKTDRKTTKSGHSYLQLTIYNAIQKRGKARRVPSRPQAIHLSHQNYSLPEQPDPKPPTTPGPGTGHRAPARQDRRITHAHHWTRQQETPEQRQEKLQNAARRATEQVELHIRNGERGLLVANVAPGVGKSTAVAPLGLPDAGLNLAWIAERRDMLTQVAALQYYHQIQPCTRHNCPDHSLHNVLGERGYNAWSVHKRHGLSCHYAQQFTRTGSAVYQLAHVKTRYPSSHQGIIIDELDVTKWLPEREVTIARLSAAARVYATNSTADLLLRACAAVITDASQARHQLHGQELFNALDRRAGGQLANWIAELAQDPHYTNTHPWYDLEEDDPAAQELEATSLAPVVLPHILTALMRELVHWQRGQAWNSCIRIGPGAHGYALSITERLRFTPGTDGLPARAILDATADAEILARLTGEQIQLEQAEIEPPPGTRHIAIRTGKRYGKLSLTTRRKDGSPNRDLQRAIAEARYILREEDPEGEARAAHTIGLVSFMGCVDELGESLDIPPERRLHFWAARGSNALEDCTILLVIGTPTIHPAAIARLARALYQDDPEPISEESTQDAQGIRRYTDPRMQRVNNYLTRAELTQCAHRSRALRQARTVITFCLGTIDYLSPTETVTDLPQLTPDGRERWTANREAERKKLDQARQEIEESGHTLTMMTVRTLKAAAGVSTDAAADYLRQARSVAHQQDQEHTPHTHNLCSHFVPDIPNNTVIENIGTNSTGNGPPAPDECQVDEGPRPGTATTPPKLGKPCRRCGHIDVWARQPDGVHWVCSCFYWWYEHPEWRGGGPRTGTG